MFLFLLIFFFVIFFILISYLLWKIKWGKLPDNFPHVLAYHKITDFELGGTWMPPGRFISQIDRLVDLGFDFIDEDRFIAVIGVGVLETEKKYYLLLMMVTGSFCLMPHLLSKSGVSAL